MYHLEISARLRLELYCLFLAKVDSRRLVPCIIANYAFASCLLLMGRAFSAQISLNILEWPVFPQSFGKRSD